MNKLYAQFLCFSKPAIKLGKKTLPLRIKIIFLSFFIFTHALVAVFVIANLHSPSLQPTGDRLQNVFQLWLDYLSQFIALVGLLFLIFTLSSHSKALAWDMTVENQSS